MAGESRAPPHREPLSGGCWRDHGEGGGAAKGMGGGTWEAAGAGGPGWGRGRVGAAAPPASPGRPGGREVRAPAQLRLRC